MLAHLVQCLRYLWAAILSEATPNRIGAAVALGALIGLLPKGNLIAIALVVVLFAIRVNLAAGVMSIAIVSWLAWLIDPVTHRIGEVILNVKLWGPICARLYSLPLVPWTAFNNTVVVGALVVGLIQWLPTYLATRALVRTYLPDLSRRLQDISVDHMSRMDVESAAWRIG
jgi:uncharacterized protein (TIGR03546 family)